MSSARSVVEKPASDFKETLDYREDYVNREKGPIHIGSRFPGGRIDGIIKDIEEKEDKSEYFGRIFCPERSNRPEEEQGWSYEKNMSYMAGAIEGQRSVILTTDIRFYGNPRNLGITNDEILWLANNGYSFRPNPENLEETIAEPGQKVEFKLIQFRNEKGRVIDTVEMEKKINNIKNEVLAQREVISQQSSYKINTNNITKQPDTQRDVIAEVVALQKAGKYVNPSLKKLADEQKKAQDIGTNNNASAPVAQSQVTSTKTHIQSYQQSTPAALQKNYLDLKQLVF